jgi:hypothetical protein
MKGVEGGGTHEGGLGVMGAKGKKGEVQEKGGSRGSFGKKGYGVFQAIFSTQEASSPSKNIRYEKSQVLSTHQTQKITKKTKNEPKNRERAKRRRRIEGEVKEVQQRNKNPQAQNLETLEGIFAWKTKDPFFIFYP